MRFGESLGSHPRRAGGNRPIQALFRPVSTGPTCAHSTRVPCLERGPTGDEPAVHGKLVSKPGQRGPGELLADASELEQDRTWLDHRCPVFDFALAFSHPG